MSQLLVSLEHLDPDAADLLKLCDEATHVDVQSHPTLAGTFQPYSTLRNIVVNGRRYADKGASCACAQLRLFTFGDNAYTVCAEHGLQEIGLLRREICNGRKHG